MRTTVLRVRSGGAPAVVDLTADVAAFVAGEGDGLVNVFVPHATAGVAVLDALLPPEERWAHRHGTPGHGRDHVVPAFVSPSVVLPVVGGVLALGTWQSVVLVDTNGDNPEREVRLSFVGG
jgi:thiamine phosphate synthase YjbQ (UPF0047 family)